MKRHIVLEITVLSMFVAWSCARNEVKSPAASPAATAAPPSGNAEQEITNLEHEWISAIVNKDTATIERLLADDFVGTTDDHLFP